MPVFGQHLTCQFAKTALCPVARDRVSYLARTGKSDSDHAVIAGIVPLSCLKDKRMYRALACPRDGNEVGPEPQGFKWRHRRSALASGPSGTDSGRLRCLRRLTVELDAEALSSLCPASVEDLLTRSGCHPCAESMPPLSDPIAGLKRALHDRYSVRRTLCSNVSRIRANADIPCGSALSTGSCHFRIVRREFRALDECDWPLRC